MMTPARMSPRPGVATPMAAMSARVSFAAATARRMVSHMVSRPASCPSSVLVSITTAGNAFPASSTTAAFIVVPPTSSPTYLGSVAMRHSREGNPVE